MADSAPERIWYEDGPTAVIARALLRPAEALYAGAVTLRGKMYDRGLLSTESPALPVLSIGNLTVGGTGKTPVAAWAAAELVALGARPAIVLRGYGGDESLVHARLNPAVPVIATPVRASGVRTARERGCDVAVLDDGFQHRRIGRAEDWVLISADRWSARRRLLPAGPWREPLAGLERATLVIVTRKAVSAEHAADVALDITRLVPGVPAAVMHLAADSLRALGGSASRTMASLSGARVHLITGIGDPGALRRQLEAHGATVRVRAFPDHHAFTPVDIARAADSVDADEVVVCTLKDAVKIGKGWPRAAPALWYVSQRVTVEAGADLLSGSLAAVLRARSRDFEAARAGGPHP